MTTFENDVVDEKQNSSSSSSSSSGVQLLAPVAGDIPFADPVMGWMQPFQAQKGAAKAGAATSGNESDGSGDEKGRKTARRVREKRELYYGGMDDSEEEDEDDEAFEIVEDEERKRKKRRGEMQEMGEAPVPKDLHLETDDDEDVGTASSPEGDTLDALIPDEDDYFLENEEGKPPQKKKRKTSRKPKKEEVETSSDDDVEMLAPSQMIDAQPGQKSASERSVFGITGQELFSDERDGSKRARRKAKGRSLIYSKRVQFLISKANQMYHERRFQDAIEICNEIVKESPSIPEPYNLLALIWAARGNEELEFEALLWATDLDTNAHVNSFSRMVELGVELASGLKEEEEEHEDALFTYDYGQDHVDDKNAVSQGALEITKPSDRRKKSMWEDIDLEELIEVSQSKKKRQRKAMMGRRRKASEATKRSGGKEKEVESESSKGIGSKRATKRREYLEKAESAVVEVLWREPSEKRLIQRAEILLELGKYDVAAEIFKRRVISQMRKNKIDLVIVHHLARAYLLQRCYAKMEEVLRLFSDCILYPLPEEISDIEKEAKRRSAERLKLQNERRRRKEALRKRQQKLENLAQKKATIMPVLDVFQEIEDDMLDKGADDDNDDNGDGKDDDCNGVDSHVVAERIQLEAGSNLLSMYVEYLVFAKELHADAVDLLERHEEFIKTGLCAYMAKNQWTFWEEMEAKMFVDLVLIQIIAYVHLHEFKKARERLFIIRSAIATSSNTRILRLASFVGEAWSQQKRYLWAINTHELILENPEAGVVEKVNACEKAAWCCECIYEDKEPKTAAQTAIVDAAEFRLACLRALAFPRARNCFMNLEERRSDCLRRLGALYTEKPSTEFRKRILEAFDECWGPSSANQKAKRLRNNLEQFLNGSRPTIFEKNELVIFPHEAEDLGEGVQLEQAEMDHGELAKLVPEAEMADIISMIDQGEVHDAFKRGVGLVKGLFFFDRRKFKKFVWLALGSNSADDAFAIKGATIVKVDNDSVVHFVVAFCKFLHRSSRIQAAIFLLRVVASRRQVIGETEQVRPCIILLLEFAIEAGDFDTAFQVLAGFAKMQRHSVSIQLDWGNKIPEVWTLMNDLVSCASTHQLSEICKSLAFIFGEPSHQKDQSRIKNFQMLMVDSHIHAALQNPIRALGGYSHLLLMAPKNALVSLCLATSYAGLFQNEAIPDQQEMIFKAFVHMEEYQQKRISGHSSVERNHGMLSCETFYNLGRLSQQLGISFLSESFYQKALCFPNASIREKREAAFNLVLHYKAIGNTTLAKKVTEKYLFL